jgi:hypothetical protein
MVANGDAERIGAACDWCRLESPSIVAVFRFKPMSPLRFPVVVVMERVPLANRWVDARWQPGAVIPVSDADPEASPERPACIADGADGTAWSFPGHAVELHPSEGEGYYLNLTAPEPKAFVMWRPAEDGEEPAARVVLVTLSYNEAARMLDGGERVDSVPLARELFDWMKPFVEQHYRPEPRKKIRRNDPFREDGPRR